MSNPCETIDQCLDALDVLDEEIRRAKRQQERINEELIGKVIDAVKRGELPVQAIKVDRAFIRRVRRFD